jgi:hypothetical protein
MHTSAWVLSQKARPVIVTIVPSGTVSLGKNSMVEVVGDGFAQADDKPYDNITIAVKAANPVIRASDCMTLLLLANLSIPTAQY